MLVLDLIKTLAAVAVPVVVAVVGYRLNQRLKLWEASQWRNQELIKARLRYYDELAPRVNDLMCYLTFLGRWRDLTPPDVLQLKRETDRLFYAVSPLFSERAVESYQEFIATCFQTFRGWGLEPRIRSGFVRRRESRPDSWDPEWCELFTHSENDEVTEEDLAKVRDRYDQLLAALAEDIELSAPRNRYVTAPFTSNAR